MKFSKNKIHKFLCALLLTLPVFILLSFDLFKDKWPSIFTDGYPRSFFFRRSENVANFDYETWEKTFNRLGGIMGKTQNEELLDRKTSLPFFQKFKQRNPGQAVFLHYNGNARDPLDGQIFYQGHWLYYQGTPLQNDIAATDNVTTISVKNASIFKLKIGRNKDRNDDVAICRLKEDGSLDWNYAEQLVLLDADYKNNTLTVKRGQYHTSPLKFEAGKSVVSPHAVEGPWGDKNNLLWLYNHSTESARDKNGHTCDDVLIADIAGKFAPGGELNLFDGVEFDVLWNELKTENNTTGRKVDVNNDGKGDNGYINGINVYSIGVFNYCRDLRKAMGNNKLILADGMTAMFQRGVGFLNGIESEGWPHLRDPQIEDWSGGWNRHLFWNQNSAAPVFNYINFKYAQNVEPGPINAQRLVWATSQLLDAYLTSGGYNVSKDKNGIRLAPLDEVYDGANQKKSWLGKPLEPTVRVALTKPDLLKGTGKSVTGDFISRITGSNVAVNKKGTTIEISGKNDEDLQFAIKDIPANGNDIVISFDVMCDPRNGYPKEMPRLLNMNTADDAFKQMSWMNGKWFNAVFYLRKVNTSRLDLLFNAESPAKITIRNFTVHAFPDVAYRRFEKGIIIVNPSYHNYEFDLTAISPGKKYYRLMATESQDSVTNNGKAAGDKVLLGERAGLFLKIK